MACRVGSSTNPQERIQYWKRKEGHTSSDILASGLTYDQAQARESREAKARDCTASGGGERVPGNGWSVYIVSGGTIS